MCGSGVDVSRLRLPEFCHHCHYCHHSSVSKAMPSPSLVNRIAAFDLLRGSDAEGTRAFFAQLSQWANVKVIPREFVTFRVYKTRCKRDYCESAFSASYMHLFPFAFLPTLIQYLMHL